MYSDYTTGVYKRTQQNKRLTFVRIEINIFSQSSSMKVLIFLRPFVDTLCIVSLIKCTPLQLDMQHTNDQHSTVVMQLQYTSMDTT